MIITTNVRSTMKVLGVFAAIIFIGTQTAFAQSTIWNIPSTDVVAPGDIYFEFDFLTHPESHNDGGFQAYVPRAVVGVAKGVEVGVNVSFLDNATSDQAVYASPNIKWQFYNGEENGVAASVGGLLYTPIANRGGADTFGLIYTTVSKKVSGNYGPRLTGGAYGLPGLADGAGTKGGAILGYEQPLHAKVSFVNDWLSGKNAFGYVTTGLSFTLPKRSLLNVGYSIGNQGAGNNAIFIYFGKTF